MSYTETSNLANFRMHSEYLLIFGEDDQFYCYGCRNMGEVFQKLTDRIYEELDYYENVLGPELGDDFEGNPVDTYDFRQTYAPEFYELYDEVMEYGNKITDMDLIKRVFEYIFVDDRNFIVLDQQCRVVASYSHYER